MPGHRLLRDCYRPTVATADLGEIDWRSTGTLLTRCSTVDCQIEETLNESSPIRAQDFTSRAPLVSQDLYRWDTVSLWGLRARNSHQLMLIVSRSWVEIIHSSRVPALDSSAWRSEVRLCMQIYSLVDSLRLCP